ncbi:MAG: glutamate-cysteine ligase family protein [Clostridiales bacterium]|nr:glutamate-cysteine ligase family protein [Clostridiales bacterium]
MIDEKTVREHLYRKYIEPTKKERELYIGIELELPIVNLDREAVDFANVHQTAREFIEHFQFRPTGWDDEGNMYAAECPKTGDIFSFDCSYNNLELSMGREKELHTLNERFSRYYRYLNKLLGRYHYTLTGMGINPYRIYNHNVPIENGRYRMLFHHLALRDKYQQKELMYFHEYPAFGTFCSASQVQLDVSYDDLLLTMNVFSRLEPITALLFGNSVLLGEHEDLLCSRDMLWENSSQGINPHNIGMFDCHFDTVEDLLSYIESTSIYCVEREEKYINFRPVCVRDYFQKESVRGEYFADGGYHEIDVIPQIADLAWLRTFKFEDLTFRGTVEFRSACCQPVSDSMAVAAFYVGLKEKLSELSGILANDRVIYHHGYNQMELRKLFVKRELPGFVNADRLYHLAGRIVKLAEEGLRERGFGEECYLEPLYGRVKSRENPAMRMLRERDAGRSIEEIILEYRNL